MPEYRGVYLNIEQRANRYALAHEWLVERSTAASTLAQNREVIELLAQTVMDLEYTLTGIASSYDALKIERDRLMDNQSRTTAGRLRSDLKTCNERLHQLEGQLLVQEQELSKQTRMER
jgi:hypothetical protein